MKRLLLTAVLIITAGSCFAQAQEKNGKADKKTMIFKPGANTPEADISSAPPASVPPTAAAGPAPALEGTGSDAPSHIAGIFFGLLQKGELDQAYDTLTRGSKIGERPEDLKTLKAKTKEAIEVFGAVLGYEVIESKPLGSRLLRRTYISLGKEFPLRWRFYFYRSENVWRLIDLRVDDRLTGMFDEPDEPRAPEAKP